MSKSEKEKAEGNIQTFLRIRPSKNPSGFFVQDDLDKGTMNIDLPESIRGEFINNSKLHHQYHFNGILPMDATQEQVFDTVGKAAVKNALDG
jgi:kinesin family member 6/9